jgi:hypothetical protein
MADAGANHRGAKRRRGPQEQVERRSAAEPACNTVRSNSYTKLLSLFMTAPTLGSPPSSFPKFTLLI